MRLFEPLYDRVLEWSRHRHAERYLAGLSFAEASFFPIPVDVMLAPMCLADRDKWVRLAIISTIASVLGGLAGYAIGYGMFEVIEPWLRDSHYWEKYLTSRRWLDAYGFWIVFVAGFSPLPYKIFTIAAGVAVINLPIFFLASLISRGARYFLVTGLIRLAGERFETSLRQHIERVGWATVVVTAIGIGWMMMRG